MKTFAQLKRDLVKGKTLTMTYNRLAAQSERITARINMPRYIVAVQSNGVQLAESATAPKGSFLELPRASAVDYTDDTITVYEPATRPLTPDEQAIIDGIPSHQKDKETVERLKMEMMTDTNGSYWKDKAYLKEHNAQWYHEETRGLYYKMGENLMRDANIKGEISIIYKLS